MSKPVLIYDGDCIFCRTWIERWRFYTEDNVEYQSYQQVSQDYPEIPQENFKKSVQLIEPDGNIDGVWWKREWKKSYMPVFSLNDVI